MTDWCILLPSPANGAGTLRLLDSMTEADIDAWAPVELKLIKGKDEPERSAILPGFVFARAVHMVDLHDLAHSPAKIYRVWNSVKRRMVVKSHPYFRMFRNEDGYSLVPEAALVHLRRAERKRKPRGLVKTYHVGDPVRILGAGFDGLDGVVIATQGKKATIAFDGKGFIRDATVPMDVLLDAPADVHVCSTSNERAHIARAA